MERHSAYRATGTPSYTTVGKARELKILKLLARYDLLPSSYIQHSIENYEANVQALRNLTKGHYIGLPDLPRDEKLAYIPRNSHYVYELKTRGRVLLAKHDIIPGQGGNDHYKHRRLRSELEYLLDYAPMQVYGVNDILSHHTCPDTTRDAPFPFRIPPKPALEPDITRGFGDGDSYLFVHIEVDRGTEPVLSLNARQSLRSKVQRYLDYMESGAYKTHFGFAVAPSVLFMTTRNDLRGLLSLFPKEGKFKDRFYATTVPEKPLPTYNLFVPWQGVHGTLDLKERFNVVSEESGESERVGADYQNG